MQNDEITLDVPPSLEKYTIHFGLFFAGMIEKLDKNSHKDTPTIATIPKILSLLQGEVEEFKDQFYEDKNNENTLIELMDVANFAFLAYIALRLQGVEHVRKIQDNDRNR
jgi:hypothetical protein